MKLIYTTFAFINNNLLEIELSFTIANANKLQNKINEKVLGPRERNLNIHDLFITV